MLTRSLILSSPECDLSFTLCTGASNEGGLSLRKDECWLMLPHCFVILSVCKRALVNTLALWPVKWWQLCAKDIEWWKAAVPRAAAYSWTTMFGDASPCTVAVFTLEHIQVAQQGDSFICAIIALKKTYSKLTRIKERCQMGQVHELNKMKLDKHDNLRKQLVLPKELKPIVLKHLHNMGHMGTGPFGYIYICIFHLLLHILA